MLEIPVRRSALPVHCVIQSGEWPIESMVFCKRRTGQAARSASKAPWRLENSLVIIEAADFGADTNRIWLLLKRDSASCE
jgi:hypothetical protein